MGGRGKNRVEHVLGALMQVSWGGEVCGSRLEVPGGQPCHLGPSTEWKLWKGVVTAWAGQGQCIQLSVFPSPSSVLVEEWLLIQGLHLSSQGGPFHCVVAAALAWWTGR